MIITDFSKILCNLEGQELKDCLLMIADELPDKGGNELRRLVNREVGLDTVIAIHNKDFFVLACESYYDNPGKNKEYDCARVPDRYLLKHPTYSCFLSKEEAWKFLLEKLENDHD